MHPLPIAYLTLLTNHGLHVYLQSASEISTLLFHVSAHSTHVPQGSTFVSITYL